MAPQQPTAWAQVNPELQEQLEEVNKQNSISCDALDLAATRHDDELRAVGTERDSLRAQLTEAQQKNEVLRAERDRLREELTRFLQWECGELAMSERLPKQSFTSGSPEKLGGAVSREELVAALRLPGAHGPVEYALNRVATALERGGKTDG